MSARSPVLSMPSSRAHELEQVRVLLAEEDDFLRWVLDRLLVENGYAVTTASTGRGLLASLAQAFESPSSLVPHVIVASATLPEESGLEVLERIHRAGWRAPFIVCAEGDDEDVRRRAWESGASYLLTKPFDPERLMGAIEDVVGAREKRA